MRTASAQWVMSLLVTFALVLAGCADTGNAASGDVTTTSAPSSTDLPPATAPTSTAIPVPRTVMTGAAILAADGFALLAGLRVGLIANHTSLVGDARLVDLLAARPDVELVAIFAPEHGVTGTADAGELIGDEIDPLAGVPIFSLYGETTKPTPEMLAGLDVLVYDLQDVGTRFYTYISTMGLAMEAAAAADVAFVVLDRPNPIGGDMVAGFVREPSQESFIGQYPVPSTYGLTAGELALAILGEGWMTGLSELDLTVVEMDGWRRSDRWPDTGIEWVAPSPGLPNYASAAAYPGTVLFEATSISYGTGTREPFAVIGAPWADGAELVADLDARSLPGVRFEEVRFTPTALAISPTPPLEGEPLEGVRVVVTEPATFDPVASGIHLLEAFQTQAGAAGIGSIIDRGETFDLLAGTPEVRDLLDNGATASEVVAAWGEGVAEFSALRDRYLLYGP
jgi:uncharacterized protein YbbC (DUF1343 family)